jgi:hypothetical protein
MPRWLACIFGIAVCLVVIFVVAPLVPSPGSLIIEIFAWLIAVALLIMMVMDLVHRSPRV